MTLVGTPENNLDQCLISPVLGGPSKSNMVNGWKHCSNMNDHTFIIFIDHSEGN